MVATADKSMSSFWSEWTIYRLKRPCPLCRGSKSENAMRLGAVTGWKHSLRDSRPGSRGLERGIPVRGDCDWCDFIRYLSVSVVGPSDTAGRSKGVERSLHPQFSARRTPPCRPQRRKAPCCCLWSTEQLARQAGLHSLYPGPPLLPRFHPQPLMGPCSAANGMSAGRTSVLAAYSLERIGKRSSP